MTLLQQIKANPNYQKLAESGSDALLVEAMNAEITPAVPITSQMLTQAAPTTMAAIASGPNYLEEMDVIASRLRANDWLGIGGWADIMLMAKKMIQSEHDAVEALVAAALPPTLVTLQQIEESLNSIRTVGGEDVGGGHRAGPIDWSKVT